MKRYDELSSVDEVAITINDLDIHSEAIPNDSHVKDPSPEGDHQENQENHDEDDQEEEEEEETQYNPLELASIIANIDFGSYMIKNIGKAGESPEYDILPRFASVRRRWYYFLWENHPNDWKIVSCSKPVDDPYQYDFQYEDKPIYLKDLTEIYVETTSNHGLRLYKDKEIIQLLPMSYSLKEASDWADAIRSAFILQDLPEEYSMNIRQRYYEMLSQLQIQVAPPVMEGGEMELYHTYNNRNSMNRHHDVVLGDEQAQKQENTVPADVGCFGRCS